MKRTAVKPKGTLKPKPRSEEGGSNPKVEDDEDEEDEAGEEEVAAKGKEEDDEEEEEDEAEPTSQEEKIDEEINAMKDNKGHVPKPVHDWLSKIGRKGRNTPPKQPQE